MAKRHKNRDFKHEVEELELAQDEFVPERGPVTIRILKVYGQYVDFMILYHSEPAHVHILRTIESMDKFDMLDYIERIDKKVGVANLEEVLSILRPKKED